ncbi:unnamed protein product [Allacma fusca]|uniref:DUF4806 domain-containing protein n=1 Tax=Allacma fusca TaxID=39272 RepID=A0A8J2NXD5_9HEXA|nr:unnamed protein product [Allacma fusca]
MEEVHLHQFKNTFCRNFEIVCQTGDNTCILQDGTIVQVLSIARDHSGEIQLIGKKMCTTSNFYQSPCGSDLCGISIAKIISGPQTCPLSAVFAKCIAIPTASNVRVARSETGPNHNESDSDDDEISVGDISKNFTFRSLELPSPPCFDKGTPPLSKVVPNEIQRNNLFTPPSASSVATCSKYLPLEVCGDSDFNLEASTVGNIELVLKEIQENPEHRELAKSYLSRAGGDDITEVTNNIFRKLMTDEVCSKFTLYGTVDKSSFVKLESFELIVDAVRSVRTTATATETEIKKAMMLWFQHASDRIKAYQKSQAKKHDTDRQ